MVACGTLPWSGALPRYVPRKPSCERFPGRYNRLLLFPVYPVPVVSMLVQKSDASNETVVRRFIWSRRTCGEWGEYLSTCHLGSQSKERCLSVLEMSLEWNFLFFHFNRLADTALARVSKPNLFVSRRTLANDFGILLELMGAKLILLIP